MEKFETSIAEIEKIGDQLLKVSVKDGAIIDEVGLQSNLELYRKIAPEGAYFLTIFKETNTADRNVKLPFESYERTKLKKAEAFVVSNLANRIELEYYINKTKQIYPTKVFENEEDALDWLEMLRS